MDKIYMLSVIDHILDFEHIGSEYMTINLSTIEQEVLKRITLNGYRTRYQLYKKDKVASSSSIHYTLKKLLDYKLIEIKKTEPSRIPEKPQIFYGLTFRGLVQALKIEGVKLHRIRNKDDLLLPWFHRALAKDSELKISQRLFGASFLKARDEAAKTLEKNLIDFMKNSPEEIEQWLKHFDLEYSDDRLIFGELSYYILSELIKKSVGM